TLSIEENKEEIRNGSGINNQTKNENEPTWEGFLVWAGKRLSKSSIQSLKQLRVQFENEELSIVGGIDDFLKIIITKYFKEETKLKTEIKFVKEAKEKKKVLITQLRKRIRRVTRKIKHTLPNRMKKYPYRLINQISNISETICR
ncbi:hypothetical protein LEP1GSC041_0623, partial [Leptospira noguchii str. 2006001870]